MKYQLKNEAVKFDIDDPISSLLKINGITDVEDYIEAGTKNWGEVFNRLEPMYYLVYKEIAEEILADIGKHKKFGILADCDVDGYASAALLYRMIKSDNESREVSVFIHSGKEHGLTDSEVLEEIMQSGIDDLLVPDAGSSDLEQIKLLMSKGIKTFVFDHHEVELGYKNPGRVINPFLFVSRDFTDLSGCAVVYTFLHYMRKPTIEENEMTAMSLVSDSMDCTSLHNRYLLDLGFDHRPIHPLFKVMVDSNSYFISNYLDPVYCSFNIIPRMNALIRMGSQEEKRMLFKALCGEDEFFDYTKRDKSVIRESIYERVSRLGKNAQARQRKIATEDAEKIADYVTDNKLDQNKILIIGDIGTELNTYTKGIAASKISSKFNRPVVIGKEKDGSFTGSIRNGCDYISDFKELLEQSKMCEVAGHSNAAGIKFDIKKKNSLIKFFNDTCNASDYSKVYYVDAIFNEDEISDYLASQIDSFSKYQAAGIGEAKFAIKHVTFNSDQITFMGEGKHCKWVNNGVCYIIFNFKDTPIDHFINDWYNGPITVIGSICLNSYDGIFIPEIKIEDAQIE